MEIQLTDARKDLSRLVRGQNAPGAKPVKIKQRGRVTAVLLGIRQYEKLTGPPPPKHSTPGGISDMVGSVRIIGDLESGTRQLAREWERSIRRTAKQL